MLCNIQDGYAFSLETRFPVSLLSFLSFVGFDPWSLKRARRMTPRDRQANHQPER